MHDAGETVSFNTLHERLHPSLQESLAAVVLDSGAGGATLEDGLACIEALRRADRESLIQRIEDAHQIGRARRAMKDALELARQLSQIS